MHKLVSKKRGRMCVPSNPPKPPRVFSETPVGERIQVDFDLDAKVRVWIRQTYGTFRCHLVLDLDQLVAVLCLSLDKVEAEMERLCDRYYGLAETAHESGLNSSCCCLSEEQQQSLIDRGQKVLNQIDKLEGLTALLKL